MRVGALILALLLLATEPPAGALKWQEFASKTGRFSALFPGEPKASRQTAGKVQTFLFSVEPRKGMVFRVGYTELPTKPPTPDAALASYAAFRKGEILTRKKVRLNDDFPGTEAVLQFAGGTRARLRIFITKKRQYHILVEGLPEFVRSRDASKFLNSLYASDE